MFTYKVNIAVHNSFLKRAVHFALVNLNADTLARAQDDFKLLCEKFPASEGFSLHLQKHPLASHETIAYSEGA